jgi:hypothetical protein
MPALLLNVSLLRELIFHTGPRCAPGAGTFPNVKMIAEYLEHALQFDRMASEAVDAGLKESLEKQAADYRKLARERAARMNLPPPPIAQKRMENP